MLLFCFASCEFAPKVSRISLRCVVPANARTVLPEESTEIVAYSITGVGPSGNEVGGAGTSPIFHFDGLLAGDWTIVAAALSPSGKPVYQGRIDVRLVPGGEPSYELLLEGVSGQGSIVGVVSWPAGAPVDPSVTVEITSIAGETVDAVVSQGESIADFGPIGAEAGYYRADITVLDGAEVLAGRSEVLRVVADFTTRLDLDFDPDSGRFSGLVGGSVIVEDDSPLAPTVELPDLPLLVGETAVFAAAGVTDAVDYSFSVDGVPGGTGETFALVVPPGPLSVDVTAVSGARAGSAGVVLEPVEAVFLGSVAYRRSIVRARDGVPGLDGARAVASSKSGRAVFVAGYSADRIVVVGRDARTGRHEVVTAVEGPELDGVSDLLVVTNDGTDYLLAAASRAEAVLLYQIVESGDDVALQKVAEDVSPGAAPARLGTAPGEDTFFACDADADQMRFFSITGGADSPTLTVLSTLTGAEIPGLTDPVAAVFAPGGGELIVASGDGDTILHLTGSVGGPFALLAEYRDGVGPVDSLNRPEDLLLSPDGLHLYVSSYYDNAVTWFSRPAVGEAFSFAGVVRDGEGGATGLRYTRGLAFAPDRSRIYAAGSSSDAVVSLTRAADGSIAFETMIDGGVLGIDADETGLDGPRALTWSPSGDLLYCAASTGDALLLLPALP